MRRFSAAALLAVTAAGAVVLTGASPSSKTEPPKAGQRASVPVLAAKATAEDVPILLRGLGTVTAYNSVQLRSRVEGAITAVNFKEGQAVKKGDLLVQLDPRPYRATLDQAKATLARDQASAANAKGDLARYSDLLKRNYTPEQQVATQRTTVAQDEAAIQSDQAAVRSAQLNVDYAALRSPIDGVTGIRQVDIGNIVQANSAQTLVTITQIEPIYVVFTLPEADIDAVRQAMAKGPMTVEAYAADDVHRISSGVLDLIDNAVDQTTGTVKLKAEFKNIDRALWPGEFVNAHAVLRIVHGGVVVPSAAVLTGPSGPFTYVIGSDGKAKIRPVTVTQTESNQSLIGKGLTAGEEVVTAGQFRLQDGTSVHVVQQLADAGQTLSDAPAGTGAAP